MKSKFNLFNQSSSKFNLMNRSLFLISKVILSNGNLSYGIKIYLVSQNLKSKFILSTFRSLPFSYYSSVTKKKINCIVKVCSVFAVEWNWQLRGVFNLIAEQKNKELHRLEITLSMKGSYWLLLSL